MGENLDPEIAEQESLVDLIKDALQEKASNPGAGGGILKIEKTSTEGLVDTYTITYADESTSTFTVTNGKSAYDYAKEAGYAGTESSFAAQLADTSMVGSWTFIDDPDLTTLPDESTELSFISNGAEYSTIKRGIVGPSNLGIYGMYYGDRAVYVNSPDESDGITHGWLDDAYKTVTITKEPSDSSIVAGIKDNAEMVGTPSKRLKTRSKRVVDAINELNDKLDETGIDQVKSIDTWAGEVQDLAFDSNAGGIMWNDKFAFYDQPESDGERIASGDIAHRIPLVPGENVTFEIDEENQVVKINATGDGTNENVLLNVTVSTDPTTTMSAIITAIEEAGGDATDITFVQLTGYINTSVLMKFRYCGGNNYFVNCTDLFTGEKIHSYITENVIDITNKPIREFLDEGRPRATLPNIRFANFYDLHCSMMVEDGNKFFFTFENMGCGTLQAGDKLQLCLRKTYWYKYSEAEAEQYLRSHYKKQKLRMIFEHEITEDEVASRFLQLEIDAGTTDDEKIRKLFKNEKTSSGTLSPMYFRLKRVTRYGSDERECDAIFSNIVTVWKTYALENHKLSVK